MQLNQMNNQFKNSYLDSVDVASEWKSVSTAALVAMPRWTKSATNIQNPTAAPAVGLPFGQERKLATEEYYRAMNQAKQVKFNESTLDSDSDKENMVALPQEIMQDLYGRLTPK